MTTLFKKYNKVILLVIILILSIVSFGQFLIKSEVKQSNETDNFAVEQKQIVIDETEDIATLGYPGQRKIVEDKNGNFYVAYRKKYKSYYQIFIAKLNKEQDGKWIISGTKKPVVFIESNQRVPSIAIDSKDILHIVWYGADSESEQDNRQIKYSRSIDGGNTWDNWKNISPVSGYSGNDYWQEHPSIFTGLNDELYVVWEGKDIKNSHQQIKFSKLTDDDQSWQNWINVGVSSNNSQSRPNIVQDDSGRLHVLMYSSLGGRAQQIWHSYSENNGDSWNVWQNVSNSSFDSRHISAIVDKENNLYAVWRAKSNNDGPAQIHFSALKNNEWLKPIIVASSPKYQFSPSITIDEGGASHIVWMEVENDYNFPREWPENGKIYTSYFSNNENKFFKAQQLGLGNDNLYPSFSSDTNTTSDFPFVYTKNKKFRSDIIIDWISQ